MSTETTLHQRLDQLADAYQTLTKDSVDQLMTLYAPEAQFKDPFNDVRGTAAIRRIFTHMFVQIDSPRFIVDGCYLGAGASTGEAVLRWELRFFHRGMGRAEQTIVGTTWLRFDDQHRVILHRDYWDASEELFSKLPLLGPLTRALRRTLRAR